MAHRKLVGKTESISFEEAEELFEKHRTEFLYWMYDMIKTATDDEDEQAQAEVNMANKLGSCLSACEMMGVLEDPDVYLAKIPHNEGVRIEECL